MKQERFRMRAGLAAWLGTCTLLGVMAWFAPPAQAADQAVPITVRQEWFRETFGSNIGLVGISVADLDGDQLAEVVAAANAGNDYWYVVKAPTPLAPLRQAYMSSPYTAGISSICTADVNGDGHPEIIVGTGRDILTYSGTTYELLGTLNTAAASGNSIWNLKVADVDGDGELEFVFTDGKDLFAYGVQTVTLKYKLVGYGGSGTQKYGIAIGNVDTDASLEIITSNGSSGVVVNCVPIDPQAPDPKPTYPQVPVIKWTSSPGFGIYTCTGDIDSDGIDEIVSGYSNGSIQAFDADLQASKFVMTGTGLQALSLADVDNDGKLEILRGEWYELKIYDAETQLPAGSIPNPAVGVTRIVAGDFDGDGHSELIWGCGNASTNSDGLIFADPVLGFIKGILSDLVEGPFLALDYGDVDNDTRNELLYGSTSSLAGVSDGLWFVHDAANRTLEYISAPPTGVDRGGMYRVRHANVDADEKSEVFITTSMGYTGVIICYNGTNHLEKWRFLSPDGLTFASLQIADVDGDGQSEVVAGTRNRNGSGGAYFYVLKAESGLLEWRSPAIGTTLSLLRIADVDGDSRSEIVMGDYGGGFFIFDGQTQAEKASATGLNASSLETADINGDNIAEILLGRSSGAIELRNGTTAAYASTVATFSGKIEGLVCRDLTADARPEYIFAANNRLMVADGANPASLLYQSPTVIGNAVGQQDSIMADDIDGDGKKEIVVNLGLPGIQIYEASAGTGACCVLTSMGYGTCDIVSQNECVQAGGTYAGSGVNCGLNDEVCDFCPEDPDKNARGVCGCNHPDTDRDSDGFPDCIDPCPDDTSKRVPGRCGCDVPDTDVDSDGLLDCFDLCPIDPLKVVPGACGCGVADADSDSDGTLDCNEACPLDASKTLPGFCGCGVPDTDRDGDHVADCLDNCPDDPQKTNLGVCGCGTPDTDTDHDGVPDCVDNCEDLPDIDTDTDGVLNCDDLCPNDYHKSEPGQCGCGLADFDNDSDGIANCSDGCKEDSSKTTPGQCGCGNLDTDGDSDGTADCIDTCPQDGGKTTPGVCGCGVSDADSDSDGTVDCKDLCPSDAHKTAPGTCGCGKADTDSDGDGKFDCQDSCPNDAKKTVPGQCGCGVSDVDTDHDGTPDCGDFCPQDARKTMPGACGCGTADTDTDADGTPDCKDACPSDAKKTAPGVCGCGKADADADSDGVADCVDNCPNKANPDQADSNHDGVGDACTAANEPSGQNQPDPNANTGGTGNNTGQSGDSSSLQIPNCGTGTAQAMAASLVALCLISSRTRRRQ